MLFYPATNPFIRPDISYEMVTEKIISQLENGIIPWEKHGEEYRAAHITG